MNACLSAAASGNVQTIEQEYQKCKCALNARTTSGQTALHLAAQHSHVDALRLLLTYGMTPSTIDNAGQTPLHIAAQSSSPEIVDILLQQAGSPGANGACSLRDNAGKTAIFYAYKNPSIEVLNKFIDMAPACGTGCTLTPEVVLRSGDGDYFSYKGGSVRKGGPVFAAAAVKPCCSA